MTDGRTSESVGLTLLQLVEVLSELGCHTAYNLDGGGSSIMVFIGELVNHPMTSERRIGEREIKNIVYIGYE